MFGWTGGLTLQKTANSCGLSTTKHRLVSVRRAHPARHLAPRSRALTGHVDPLKTSD